MNRLDQDTANEMECETFERWIRIHGYYFKLKQWQIAHNVIESDVL